MAERYRTQPLIPMVDETPSERLQRPDQRGDLLDYYLGPTGIPDRLRSANEVFNPLAGVADAVGYSRAAANPDNPPSERLRAAGNAAFETGIAALPVGVAKIAGRYARAVPGGGQADDAQAAVETLTGANPDLQDPSRRRFLATAAAAGAAPLLPAEEFLAAGTRAGARGTAGAVPKAMAKLLEGQEMMLNESALLGEARNLRRFAPLEDPRYQQLVESAAELDGGRMQVNDQILDLALDPDFDLAEFKNALPPADAADEEFVNPQALGDAVRDALKTRTQARAAESGRSTPELDSVFRDIEETISGRFSPGSDASSAMRRLRESTLFEENELSLIERLNKESEDLGGSAGYFRPDETPF